MKLVKVNFSTLEGKIFVLSTKNVKETHCFYMVNSSKLKKKNRDKISKDGIYFEIVEDTTPEKEVVLRYFKKFSNLEVVYAIKDYSTDIVWEREVKGE